jgi:hypothetical protein
MTGNDGEIDLTFVFVPLILNGPYFMLTLLALSRTSGFLVSMLYALMVIGLRAALKANVANPLIDPLIRLAILDKSGKPVVTGDLAGATAALPPKSEVRALKSN